MRITVNGETVEIREGSSLLDLVIGRGLDPRTVVAEHNRVIVSGDEFAMVCLQPDDTLELLHFVGGG